MSTRLPSEPPIRLAEFVAAWSLATDLGTGQPMQHALRACLLAVRLGTLLGIDDETLRDTFYVALLQRIGCTADAFELAAWFDDELAAHARTFTIDFARPREVLVDVVRQAGAGRPPLRRLRTVATALATGRQAVPGFFRASCEVAERLAARLGFPGGIQQAVAQVFERWDGRGWPHGLAGEAIALQIRIARLAGDAEVSHRLHGADETIAFVKRRAGSIYDPAIATRFCRDAIELLAELAVASPWEAALAAEPEPRTCLTENEFDNALIAMAEFVDLKSPYFATHSTGVAALAAAAAEQCALPTATAVAVRRAALVHDLGRAGVPNGIWDKPGPLSDEEWERVRLHPYLTERVLARPPQLARLGALASFHHERLDGSGYHRAVAASALPFPARLLAAADAYHAMTEPRPHRPALSPDTAAAELSHAVAAGKLDESASGSAPLIPPGSATARSKSSVSSPAVSSLPRSPLTSTSRPTPPATTSATSTTRSAHPPAPLPRSSRCSTICSSR
jgi:HD-GYP domain-containing protein (c-di-GMP phosphodiesterase class II)